jgi:hypothetical protein
MPVATAATINAHVRYGKLRIDERMHEPAAG